MRPSTSTGHLAHKDDVLTKLDAGIDTASSNYSSHTGRPNFFTQASNTNECVSPESYNTQADFSKYHTMTYNKVIWTCSICSCHSVDSTCRLRLVAHVPLLVLLRSLNWRSCHYTSKREAVLAKVAFFATIITSTVAFHMQADTPQMSASTTKALDPVLLGRKTPRPLGLVVGHIVRFPPLLMPLFGPRWSTNPRVLWALTFYLVLHLLHHPGLLH